MMKKSKKLFLIPVLVMMLNFTVFASNTQSEITVLLNEKTIAFDQPPIIENGRTLVPLRAIFESLGASVNWEPQTRTIISKLGATTITLQLDSRTANINDKEVILDVPAKIYSGRTLIPLRFIGEGFGLAVEWTEEKRQIKLSQKTNEPSDKAKDNRIEAIKDDSTKNAELDKLIVFKDKRINKLVRDKIKKPKGDIIIRDLLDITELDLHENSISDITGLEGLVKLKKLDLSFNEITDISPLEGLISLQELDLDNNKVADISSLKELINLERLEIGIADLGYPGRNLVSDLKPIEGLSKLKHLRLSGNQITDINALKNLFNLQSLDLTSNQIKNISALGELVNIKGLTLGYNEINDISSLNKLINLNFLSLNNNQITDISALKTLVKLEFLHLNSNKIFNISALGELENLKFLNLTGNLITDFSVLDKLPFIYRSSFE